MTGNTQKSEVLWGRPRDQLICGQSGRAVQPHMIVSIRSPCRSLNQSRPRTELDAIMSIKTNAPTQLPPAVSASSTPHFQPPISLDAIGNEQTHVITISICTCSIVGSKQGLHVLARVSATKCSHMFDKVYDTDIVGPNFCRLNLASSARKAKRKPVNS